MAKLILRKLFTMLLCLLAFFSCKQEIVAPQQQVSGQYALDVGTGLTNQYLEFDKGMLSEYLSSELYPIAEHAIWANGGKNFSIRSRNKYFIQDEYLHMESETRRIALQTDGRLTVGDKVYMRLDNFREEPYSVIKPEASRYAFPLQGGDFSIPINVDRPIPAGKLTAQSDSDWISDVSIKDGVVYFHLSTSKIPKTGQIGFTYTQAEDVSIVIDQSPSTYIRLNENSKMMGYQGAELVIPYTIDNPIPGSALTVSSSENWAKAISVQSNKVVISVPANYSGFIRSAKLEFSYVGAEDVVFSLSQDTQAITSLDINVTSLDLYIGEGATLQATVVPSNAQPRWESSNTEVATVSPSGTVKAIRHGKTIITVYCGDKSRKCTVIVSSHCPDGAVDLGLTTSEGNKLYWAECNLSETGFVDSSEKFGDYYAWGETYIKSYYSWSNYKWCEGSNTTLLKYNSNSSYGIVDNKSVLETGPDGDDVASKKLGREWRMPTVEEWEELQAKCTWEPAKQNGRVGYLITGDNGNCIFLPSAYISTPGNWGSRITYGYWSSSLSTSSPMAMYINIAGGFENNINSVSAKIYSSARYEGYYIRPVSE